MTKKKDIATKAWFPDLMTDEVRQLCYITYFGEDYGSAIPQYIRYYHKSRKNYDDTTLHLIQLGYLKTHNTTAPEHHLDVLDFLAIEHKEWLQAFKEFRQYSPTHYNEYLWKLSEMIRQDDFEGAAKLPKPYSGLGYNILNIYPYIRNRAICDVRYAQFLDGEQAASMVTEPLEEFLLQGKLDQPTLNSIRSVVKNDPSYVKLEQQVDLYEFFATGKHFEYDSPQTLWALSMTAIKELYSGHTEEALNLFQRAAATQRAHICSLPSPLLNYFYAICIIKYRIKYGVNSIPQVVNELRHSSLIRSNNNHFAARLLLEYANSYTETTAKWVKQMTEKVVTDIDNNLNRCFSVLISSFFSCSKENQFLLKGNLPNTAIMTHELAPYIALNTKAKKELETAFGGPPLLANIQRKKSWEFMLDEISFSTEKGLEEFPRRIIYFIKGFTLNSIVEQRFKDGKWEDGALLSLKKFCTQGYESMDVKDARVAMLLANKSDQVIDTDIIIPILAESGRLFYGSEHFPDRIPVEVIQEQPYIEFKGEGDKIQISSNVKTSMNEGVQKYTIERIGSLFKLITANPLQKDILQKILSHRTLPAAAAPSLRKTIDSIKGIIDVREDILSEIEQKAFESEGKITIRIEPNEKNTCFNISLLAIGLNNGTARFTPTVGEEYVYDSDETGRTYCVHRNMQSEENNFQGVVDFAEQFNIEFDDYNNFSIDNERTLLNFLAFAHRNANQYVVEWPNGQKLKFKGTLTEKDITIDIKSNVDWFSVEGKALVGADILDLDSLIESCCNNCYDGFVRIGEDEYLQITETLRRHIAALDALLSVKERKKRGVSKFMIGALAQTLDKMKHTEDSGYKEFREKMKAAYCQEEEVPHALNAQLRPYQEDGFRWLARMDAWGAGACLADDMGLGKTLQALTFLLHKASAGPSLIVAPKSVIPNWVKEVGKFTPSLSMHVLNDTSNRDLTVQEASANMLILCTYGVLTSESTLLCSKKWNVVCLDEAHQIKNRMTMASQIAMELKADSRIILTGTPIQNHVGELWNLMQFINPGILGRWNSFRDNFINTELDEAHSTILKEMTQPFILRRTKQEVLTDLPEKIEDIYYVTLNEDEFKVYETMRQKVELKFKKGKSEKEKKLAKTFDISFFEELTKLRLASCDMHLINDKWKKQSSKISALMEVLERLVSSKENNILIFSQFTSFLSLIKTELDKKGWEYFYLDGQTPMEKRETIVEGFQNGEKKIFLSSLKAGGLGINLTQANYVILMDPWWNPAIENQATDRAHRLGQKRCVSVIRFISEQTIEEKIIRFHESKQSLSNEILDGTKESYKLSYDDILDMVTPY